MEMTIKFIKKVARVGAVALVLIASVVQANNGNGNGNGNGQDKILNFKVLQNQFNIDCAYFGEIGLEIKYKLKSKESGVVEVLGTEDGTTFHALVSRNVVYGNGSFVTVVNTPVCLQNIDISIQ